MKTKQPKTIEEIKEHIKHPKSHNCVVLYRCGKDKLLMALNPFGGGICNTQELKLSLEFDVNKCNPKDFIIVYNN